MIPLLSRRCGVSGLLERLLFIAASRRGAIAIGNWKLAFGQRFTPSSVFDSGQLAA